MPGKTLESDATLVAAHLESAGVVGLESVSIAKRSGIPLYRVRYALRHLQEQELVERKARRFGQFSYTWVYRLT